MSRKYRVEQRYTTGWCVVSEQAIKLSKDEARNVIRFKNHYVITPNIEFKYDKKKYLKNKQGELGKFVENNFEYNSGTNEKFLSVKEIKKLNQNNSINDTLQSSINW